MEVGSIARTPAPSAANAPQRADTLVSAGAVKTELKPEAAVQQVREVEPVRFDPTNETAARAALDQVIRETISRRIVLEPKTREVIFQTVNEETGEVVRQVPDEALLRLRAYARELREKDDNSDVPRVERVA
jgi:flagellar protein FlaG